MAPSRAASCCRGEKAASSGCPRSSAALPARLLHLKGLLIEDVGEALWRGKVFFRDERVLRNRIEDLSILKKMGLVEGEPKKMNYGGKETWLLFPAKLYCGQSLLDARRESIIIDYFFTDEIPGYQESPDYLAGRRGLKVRDEIRMIRPGLYLGRAYLDRGFALNFTLYDKATDDKARDDFVKTGTGAGRLLARHPGARCWPRPPNRRDCESGHGQPAMTCAAPSWPACSPWPAGRER
jgi:hypothetical protein